MNRPIFFSFDFSFFINRFTNYMVIVGGGYIGLEMGSVWSRLGTEIEVVEYLDHITPGMDREISNEFMKILKKQGIFMILKKCGLN